MRLGTIIAVLIISILITSSGASAISFFNIFKIGSTNNDESINPKGSTTEDRGITGTINEDLTPGNEEEDNSGSEVPVKIISPETSERSKEVKPSVDNDQIVLPEKEEDDNLVSSEIEGSDFEFSSTLSQTKWRLIRNIMNMDLVSLSKYRGLAFLNDGSSNHPYLHKYGNDYFVELHFVADGQPDRTSGFVSDHWKDWKPGDKAENLSELDLKFSTAHDALQWFKMMKELDQETKIYYLGFATDDCEIDRGIVVMKKCVVDMDSAGNELLLMDY